MEEQTNKIETCTKQIDMKLDDDDQWIDVVKTLGKHNQLSRKTVLSKTSKTIQTTQSLSHTVTTSDTHCMPLSVISLFDDKSCAPQNDFFKTSPVQIHSIINNTASSSKSKF